MADRGRTSAGRTTPAGPVGRVPRAAGVRAGERSSELDPTGQSSRPAIAAGLAGGPAAAALRPPVVAALQRAVGNAAVGGLLRRRAEPSRTGLPDRLRASVEQLSGGDLSGVAVHYDSPEPARLDALAYAQGGEIHVAPGQEQHLPHEAWHVVQQTEGRVEPTTEVDDGRALNDDAALEGEADRMGAQAAAAAPALADGPVAAASGAARPAASAPIQAYKSVRASDGGTHVGEPSACHCHIDIGNPHFKVGNDLTTRINFGRDMSLPRLQRAYEALLAKHSGKAGYDDCKEYFEEQGCVEPEERELADTLKEMLLKWGGLSDDKISFYTDPDGTREERPVYNVEDLNDVIVGVEDEIRYSDSIYEDFLADEGTSLSPGHQGIDFEAMGEEASTLYGKERKKVQG